MSDEALARALRPVAEAILTTEEAKRAQRVERAIRGDGTVRGDRVKGRIGRSAVGTVDQVSVAVGSSNLEAALAELERKSLVTGLLLGGL